MNISTMLKNNDGKSYILIIKLHTLLGMYCITFDIVPCDLSRKQVAYVLMEVSESLT